jgi:hypothetical protein
MLQWLRNLFGTAARSTSADEQFDPVYGLPKRAVDEWLARNPRLGEEYTVQGTAGTQSPLREEYDAALKQEILALGTRR